MKKCLFFLIITLHLTAGAQNTGTVIHSKTKTSVDYNGSSSMPPIAQAFSQDLADESESFIYQKDSMRKHIMKRDKVTMTQIFNDAAGSGIILVESPDGQYAYLQTPADREAHQSRAMVVMHNTTVIDQTNRRTVMNQSEKFSRLVYTKKEKTISNISCKKVLVVNLNAVGEEREIEAWYTPGYESVRNGLLKNSSLGYAGINGLVMKYKDTSTISLAGTLMMLTYTYEIKKIDTAAVIDNSIFEIPQGYVVKTYADYMEKYPMGIPFTVKRHTRTIISQPGNNSRGPSSLVPRNF